MSDASHPRESGGVAPIGWISFAAGLLLAQQIASKATRDALFLVSFDPRRLPWMMIAGAALSLLAILVMTRALARWGPLKVLPRALALSAGLYLTEWILLGSRPEIAAIALYLHVSALGSVLVSGFWTMVSEREDPHSAKRLVARVAAAAALGATIGGLAARALAGLGGAYVMLLVLSAASLTIGAALRWLPEARGGAGVPSAVAEDKTTSVREVWGSSYLRSLAGMAALVAVWQAMLDFAFKASAHGVYRDEASLVSFFGLFYTGTSLLTFLVQTALGKLALKRGGLAATLAVSPTWVALGFAALMGTPFALLAALRGGESVLSNSLLRSAYEVLFSPLPASVRRRAKTLVDVAATRLGDGIGSVLLLVLVERELAVPLVVAAVLGLIGVCVARPLTRGYVGALTEALREGVVPGDETSVDPAPRRALSDTSVALDRERALTGIAALGTAAAGPQTAFVPPRVEVSPSLAARARALTRATEAELVRALAVPLEPELARVALRLVARDDLRQRAEAALRRVVPRAVGSIIDALLDPATPFEVRVRIPRILAEGAHPRAVDGLLLGLEDPRLEVRIQCARALARLSGSAIDAERVLAAVHREIEQHGTSWASATAEPIDDDDDPLSLDVLVRAHASRSLQYVLVLLSVVAAPKSLEHALEGLSSTDPRVRGTALELLDNVVPDAVRAPLLAALEPKQPGPAGAVDRDHLMADLLRSQEIAVRRVS